MRTARTILVLSLLWVGVSCTTPPPPQPPVPDNTVPPPVVTVPAPDDGAFQVTAEKKQSTMAEIKVLVDKLNAIIARKGFSDWTTYLDSAYVGTYGDPVRLRDYSASSPFLKQYNIKLRNLEDYFRYVVVPSRANTTVDDISFVDENRVNVWTVVDNERVLLYLLKLYGKEWKISSW